MTISNSLLLIAEIDEVKSEKVISAQLIKLQRNLKEIEINIDTKSLDEFYNKYKNIESKLIPLNLSVNESTISPLLDTKDKQTKTNSKSMSNIQEIVFDLAESMATSVLSGDLAKSIVTSVLSNKLESAAESALNVALTKIPKAGLIGILTVAAAGLLAYSTNVTKATEKTREIIGETSKHAESTEQNIIRLEQLKLQYDRLNNSLVKTQDEKKKLSSVQNELINSYPDIAHSIDVEGNAIITSSDAIREYIDLKKEQLGLDKSKIVSSFKTNSDSLRQDLNKQEKDIKEYNTKLANLKTEQSSLMELGDLPGVSNQPRLQKINQEIDKVSTSLSTALEKQFSSVEQYNQNTIIALESTNDEFARLGDGVKYALVDSMRESGMSFEEVERSLKGSNISAILDKYSASLDEFGNAQTSENLEKCGDSINKTKLALIEYAKSAGIAKGKEEEWAVGILKSNDSLAYTRVSLDLFSSSMSKLALTAGSSTGDIISAFALLNIEVNKDIAGILSGFTDLIASIDSISSAKSAVRTMAERNVLARNPELAQTPARLEKYIDSWIERNKESVDAVMSIGIKRDYVKSNIPAAHSGDNSKEDTYTTNEYEVALDKLNAQYEVLELNKSRYVNTSQEYRDVVSQEIELAKQKQTLAHEEADRLRGKIASGGLNQREVDEANKSIQDLGNEWIDLQKSINDNTFEISTSKLEEFDKRITIIKDDISNFQSQLVLLTPNTEEYNSKLQQIITATKEYSQALKDKQDLIQKELSNDDFTILKKEELRDKLRELNNEQLQLEIELKNQLSSLADEVIQIYKEMYEKQKNIALDAIDQQIKEEEKRHNQAIRNYDDELESIEDIISAKLELIDKEDDERSYTQELAEMQKERNEIQAKIDTKMLDSSYEAQSEVSELTGQLEQKDSDIEEYKYRHSQDLRKANLNNILDNYKRDIEANKEAEDAKYNAEKDHLNNLKTETEAYWNNIINDESKYAEIRRNIISGNLDIIKSDFDTFKTVLDNNLAFIGSSISNNLINQMQNAINMSGSLRNALSSVSNQYSDTNPPPSTSGQPFAIINQGEYELSDNTAIMASRAIADKLKTSVSWQGSGDGMQIIIGGKSFTPVKNVNGYTYLPIREVAEALGHRVDWENGQIEIYHQGGIIGDSPSEWAKLTNSLFNTRQNEQIINTLDDEVVIKPNAFRDNFIPNLSSLIGSFIPSIIPGNTINSSNNNYNLSVSIGGITGDKKGVDYFFREVNKNLRKIGI